MAFTGNENNRELLDSAAKVFRSRVTPGSRYHELLEGGTPAQAAGAGREAAFDFTPSESGKLSLPATEQPIPQHRIQHPSDRRYAAAAADDSRPSRRGPGRHGAPVAVLVHGAAQTDSHRHSGIRARVGGDFAGHGCAAAAAAHAAHGNAPARERTGTHRLIAGRARTFAG